MIENPQVGEKYWINAFNACVPQEVTILGKEGQNFRVEFTKKKCVASRYYTIFSPYQLYSKEEVVNQYNMYLDRLVDKHNNGIAYIEKRRQSFMNRINNNGKEQ